MRKVEVNGRRLELRRTFESCQVLDEHGLEREKRMISRISDVEAIIPSVEEPVLRYQDAMQMSVALALQNFGHVHPRHRSDREDVAG